MKVGVWAGALFFRVGLGCRCWANLCGNVPRASSRRSRDLKRGLDSIVEGSTNGDDESTEPDFPEDRTETTEESCTMALSHVDADMAQDHKLMQVDGHMRDLRTQLESLVIEFQNASAKRAQLLEDSNLCSCEVSEKDSELLGRVEGLCSKSREWSDSNEKELCKLAEGSGHEVKKCFRSKTGPQGHMRHSSGCDPEPSCSSNGNSGELSGFSHPSEDNLQPDGIILEQILETGDGEFVMDDEIDGICSVDLSQGQSTDLPTPRVFLHSGAFEPNFLNEEQHPEAFDSEVTDCDESICCEDPDDPGTIDVGNPPFAPMETQLPRPTPTWNGDDGVNEDDPCTWLSNTTFGSANGGAPEGFQSPVQFRTTHVALVEQANRANRLMNELRQTQLTLEDVQGQLDFTTERMIAYKHSMQYEQTLRMSETVELKLALDEATSSKFIMFCRLQESQTKIKNLEEEISSLQEGCANAEDAAQLKDLDEDSVICESDQSEASSKESPRPHDMQELEFNQSGFSMTLSSSNGSGGTEIVQQRTSEDSNHPLHEALSRTMRNLLDAEARGDSLQERVNQLETELHTYREQFASPRPEQSDTKPARAELKRVRSRLQRLESELELSSKIKNQQDKEITRLKNEIKAMKRSGASGQAPRWR